VPRKPLNFSNGKRGSDRKRELENKICVLRGWKLCRYGVREEDSKRPGQIYLREIHG